MTPLETYLRQRLQRKKLLLMTHVVVGYPSLDANMVMLEAMQRAEVDVVEFQLPFSEPIADGPVFVRANQRALEAGMHWDTILPLCSARPLPLISKFYDGLLQQRPANGSRHVLCLSGGAWWQWLHRRRPAT